MSNKKPALYIGLMSGTSADGIDLALVDFSTDQPILVAGYYQEYNTSLRNRITNLYTPKDNEIDTAFQLDIELAKHFAVAVNELLKSQSLCSDDIIAIGNHGQTIRHRPAFNFPFTLQIGCCQTLACLTGIEVIGHFRDKDIALGGQGAPLVPAFHQKLVQDPNCDTFFVNIGGIANITYLPTDKSKNVIGFDTGPGNALLDAWFCQHELGSFDRKGEWAESGKIHHALLQQLLADPYFQKLPPKSTGREQFNLEWLSNHLEPLSLSAIDVQATLVELTASTITDEIRQLISNKPTEKANIYLCGGGVKNTFLMKRLSAKLKQHNIIPSDQIGVSSDDMEAMAFAWLAYAYKNNLPSNLPSVTGASRSATLGVLYTI